MAGGLSQVSLRADHAPIRAVTLDVGGTLVHVWPSVGHVYAEVAARHGINGLSAKLLDRRFAAPWRAGRRFVRLAVEPHGQGCETGPNQVPAGAMRTG